MAPLAAGAFRLDDYLAYVREFLGFLGRDIHVVSVSQSTVPVLAAVSLMASAPSTSMILMGGSLDARRSPTKVNELATGRPLAWFARHLIYRVPAHYPGAGRVVYPGFLQHAAFVGARHEPEFYAL